MYIFKLKLAILAHLKAVAFTNPRCLSIRRVIHQFANFDPATSPPRDVITSEMESNMDILTPKKAPINSVLDPDPLQETIRIRVAKK